MTPQQAEALIPIAAELVGTTRDYGVEDVAAVLGRVPDGQMGALAVVLAAMVDPDARPTDLLAWLDVGPVPSRAFDARHRLANCPDCGEVMAATSVPRHAARAHPEARKSA